MVAISYTWSDNNPSEKNMDAEFWLEMTSDDTHVKIYNIKENGTDFMSKIFLIDTSFAWNIFL